MKIIGITGRSGCGKSSVTKFLAAQGYPCIDADRIAREVLQKGSPCLPVLQERFGSDILDEQGELRRRLLADRAFATPEGTRFLTPPSGRADSPGNAAGCRNCRDRERWFAFSVGKPDQGVFALLEKGGL